jgi:hypothetical protein
MNLDLVGDFIGEDWPALVLDGPPPADLREMPSKD